VDCLCRGSCISIPESYFAKKLDALRRKVAILTIPVHDLDFDDVKRLLNETLQQCSLFDLQIDEDICHVVYQQTNGNMARMLTFLQWLYQGGLLKKDRPRNSSSSFIYWTWSVDAINRQLTSCEKSRGVCWIPMYVTELLNKLPSQLIELAKICACLGCLHTEDTILECVLGFPVSSILSTAVEIGMLNRLGNGASDFSGKLYCFKYDTLQMAAYDLIPEDSRELFHLEIGRRLWRRLSQKQLDQYIFVVLSQQILGRRLITRSKEKYNIASLCLHAGRKAAKLSDFRAASIFLRFGIELLGDQGWKDVYDLALAIHNDACEMEMCAANFEGIELLVGGIMRNARSSRDRIQARTTQLYAFSVNDRQQEGLDLGLQLLREVGSPLPKRLNMFTLLRELRSVQNLLKGRSNEYLKRMPIIDDEDILSAMRILHLVRTSLLS
jgi:predicted ATPase